MAKYITRPGGHDTTYVGPYPAAGVSLRMFLLKGHFKSLMTTLDRYLGPVAPAGEFYIPLGDRIVAVFAAMEKVQGGDSSLGSMREIDVAFFIPAVRFV